MKKVYFLSLLASAACLAVEIDYHLSKHFPAVNGGVNRQGRSVGLRKNADQGLPVIAWLPDGVFAPVRAEGKRWAHIVYQNQKYAIAKKRFDLGYSRLYGLFTVPTSRYKRYRVWVAGHIRWVHLGVAFSIVSLLLARRRRNPVILTQIPEAFTSTVRQPLVIPVIPERPSTEICPPAPVPPLGAVGPTPGVDQKDAIKQNQIDQLYASTVFLKALNIEYRGRIEEMELAAENMHREFERQKRDAKILGVDLDSSKIPGLVKGRLFEVFAANIWHADRRTTIQTWTPDKGINEGIYIQSNGDPDFLLELYTATGPRLISIECKYRSVYQKTDTSEKKIQWIKYRQYKRYEAYEASTGLKVYMLLGAGGDPRSPEHLYLGPISALSLASSFDDRKDFKCFYASPEKLCPFEISAASMIDSLFDYLGKSTSYR